MLSAKDFWYRASSIRVLQTDLHNRTISPAAHIARWAFCVKNVKVLEISFLKYLILKRKYAIIYWLVIFAPICFLLEIHRLRAQGVIVILHKNYRKLSCELYISIKMQKNGRI